MLNGRFHSLSIRDTSGREIHGTTEKGKPLLRKALFVPLLETSNKFIRMSAVEGLPLDTSYLEIQVFLAAPLKRNGKLKTLNTYTQLCKRFPLVPLHGKRNPFPSLPWFADQITKTILLCLTGGCWQQAGEGLCQGSGMQRDATGCPGLGVPAAETQTRCV